MGSVTGPGRTWLPLGSVSPSTLSETRLQIHWAVQIVGAVGKTFIRPRPDDSHPNLGFVPDGGLLLSHPTDTTPSFHAALSLPSNSLLLLDAQLGVRARIDLAGLTFEEAFSWMEREIVKHFGDVGVSQLDRTLYDIPPHSVAKGARFEKLDDDALLELTAWYSNADLVLNTFVSKIQGASDVRTWPHHFDIGTVVSFDNDADPETPASVGMGMTPGDDYYDEPYFYINPYPRAPDTSPPTLRSGAVWHEEDWFGAVLTGTALVAVPAADQLEMATSYVNSAFAAAKELLPASAKGPNR